MSKLANYLNQYIVGNVFDRPSICRQYSTDRSILQISPRLVVFPESSEDIQALLRFTNQLAMRNFRLPVTLRGTGLDKTGAAIGDGLIISTETQPHRRARPTRSSSAGAARCNLGPTQFSSGFAGTDPAN